MLNAPQKGIFLKNMMIYFQKTFNQVDYLSLSEQTGVSKRQLLAIVQELKASQRKNSKIFWRFAKLKNYGLINKML